ncbi:MAG: hypothetical protein C5B51_02585 [Terriglobia bacterium]|nr:MAG: hypothetical protein C5B51_02585 [Terriglobia bacterium]
MLAPLRAQEGEKSAFSSALTAREREVLNLIARGKSSKEIAFDLRIAFTTVTCHRARILDKLAVHNTAELIRKALERGLIDLPRLQIIKEESRSPLGLRVERVMEDNRRSLLALRKALAESRLLCSQMYGAGQELRSACEAVMQSVGISQRRIGTTT